MKVKQMMFMLAAIVLLLAMGCGTAPGTQVVIKDDDFRSDSGGKLIINNNSGSELAIFIGKVERGNFIGAVGTGANNRARSRSFDIEKKMTGLPAYGTFIIRATTFDTLDRKGLSQINEVDVVYSGLIVYNRDSSDRVEHDIYRGIDFEQKTFIHVRNDSNYVLELRLGSPDGEKVSVLSPKQDNKKIWVKKNEDNLYLSLFATYLYLDPNTKEMNAFTDTEYLYGKAFEPFPAGTELEVIPFKGPGAGGPRYNVAFISFNNGTSSLMQLQKSENLNLRNDRGAFQTSGGRTDVYQIDATDGKDYPGMGIYIPDHRRFYSISNVKVQPGHKYDLVIRDVGSILQAKLEDKGLKSVSDNIRVELFGE